MKEDMEQQKKINCSTHALCILSLNIGSTDSRKEQKKCLDQNLFLRKLSRGTLFGPRQPSFKYKSMWKLSECFAYAIDQKLTGKKTKERNASSNQIRWIFLLVWEWRLETHRFGTKFVIRLPFTVFIKFFVAWSIRDRSRTVGEYFNFFCYLNFLEIFDENKPWWRPVRISR